MVNIEVDFHDNIGKLKAINGVGNGPICHEQDLSKYFKEAHITSVRYHDTDGGSAYGRCAIDVSRIFPNFDADEMDENNYYFQHTDQIMKAAYECGVKIVYRLGESIDHSIYKRHARPPKDFEKWSRICIQIIKHYNFGWANGFQFNIKHWEIWNEPEGRSAKGDQPMWDGGTFEQVLDLYKTVVPKIKQLDPTLKVGGFSFMYCDFAVEPFLSFCQKESLPIDFLSYHHYSKDLDWILEEAPKGREYLDKYGFKDTEIYITEWSSMHLDDEYQGIFWEFIGDRFNNAEKCALFFDNIKNHFGACQVASFLMLLNDLPIDDAHYYDFQPDSLWCGFFDKYFRPQKPYYAFKWYGDMLVSQEYRAKAKTDAKDCNAIATKSKDGEMLLFANYLCDVKSAKVKLNNLTEGKTLRIYCIDDKKNQNLVFEKEKVSANEIVKIKVRPNSVLQFICN